VQADVVTDWNSVALDAVIAAREAQPTQARSVTMVDVAMFEAINAIEHRNKPYVMKVSPSPGASREAAAATAAHAILMKLYPGQSASFDKALTSSLSQIPDGEAKGSGISLGEHVAQEVYGTRAAEMANSPNAYRPRTAPGVYAPTTLPVATEAARFKHWLMQEPAQFRRRRRFLCRAHNGRAIIMKSKKWVGATAQSGAPSKLLSDNSGSPRARLPGIR
jgi:hypothetical protein